MSISKRPKISIYIAASLDGYIADSNGSLDWLESSGHPDEDYGFKGLMESIDALVLGRKTYEVVSSFDKWPYQGKRVIVLSHTLKSVREEAQLAKENASELVAKLYQEGIRHIWVDGGRALSYFLKLNLVDELTLSIIPLILGKGTPLFSATL